MITTVKVDSICEVDSMNIFEFHRRPAPGSIVYKYNGTLACYDGLGIVVGMKDGEALVVWTIQPSVDPLDGLSLSVDKVTSAFNNISNAVAACTPSVTAMVNSLNSILELSGISTGAIKKTLSGAVGGKPKHRKGNKRGKHR